MKIINYGTKWSNGEIGKFEESNLELKWIELSIREGVLKYRYPIAERYHNAPIVARGFIVYLLKAIEADPNIKSADLFDSYFRFRLDQYKKFEELKPDAFSRNLDNEFYDKHIEEEQKYTTSSKGFFDYLEKNDHTFIKNYCDNYFTYIKKYGNIKQEVPDELQTEEAKAIFSKAIKAGFMNEDFSFIGTKYQMAYFAEKAYEKLNLKYKWKCFEALWDTKFLSQTRHESIENFGYVKKQDEIDTIFD